MKDQETKLIWEAYAPTKPETQFTWPDVNENGARNPRLTALGNDSASMDVVQLGPDGQEIGYYEVHAEWSWYGESYGATESSPAEEPQVDDISISSIIDQETNKELLHDEGIYNAIYNLVHGELEAAGSSYLGAMGMEFDDGY